jgi:energy-coupling factor transport system ATP-binding protein
MPLHPVGIRATEWGWRHASRSRWALHGLDFVIEPGERVLLLGASGSGKSTLLQAMAGVLGGSEEGEAAGELLVNGLPATQSRGHSGLLLQDPDSQVILARVGDDVAFGCENLGVPREQIWPRVQSALDAVGLRVPLDRSTSELSGGQKQRLALAGILAMQPSALLLDEPTANLDPTGVTEVREAVGRVLERTGATFVVVEHRVEVWLPLVNRVIVLSAEGSVIADGRPDDVLRTRGAELAASGVWVPGFPPAVPSRSAAAGATLLTTSELTVGRGLSRRQPPTFARACPDVGIREGTTTALTGANGSGKTTVGLTLAGLLPPIAGEVLAREELRGHAGKHPIGWKSRELLTRIGTVFQEPEHQFLRATVRDELAVGPRALKLTNLEVAARVDELLERLRLSALAQANPFTLSGGEKRRLSVATVLASRPRILVLDEPTFGQDSRTWEELVALLSEYTRDQNAIIAMTHDQLFVDALADEVVRL